MFYVYILKNKTGKTYVGYTGNIKDRLHRHNSGFEKSTKNGIPWDMVYTEIFQTRGKAMKKEKYLKTGVGREWIKRSIL